jgi:hypothetical protein
MFGQDEQSNIKLLQCTGTVKQNFLLRCRVVCEDNAQKLVVEDGIISQPGSLIQCRISGQDLCDRR